MQNLLQVYTCGKSFLRSLNSTRKQYPYIWRSIAENRIEGNPDFLRDFVTVQQKYSPTTALETKTAQPDGNLDKIVSSIKCRNYRYLVVESKMT